MTFRYVVIDTIRSSSTGSRETIVEITVQGPLTADLGVTVGALREQAAVERDAPLRLRR
jgi:hypothetical protein